MAGGKRKRDSIHETPDVSYIHNPDVAYEHTDVPVTPVLKFIFGLVVFAIVVHVAMWLLFNILEKRSQRNELQPSPLARQGKDRLPPEPRLQLAPGWSVTTQDGREVNLSYGQMPNERDVGTQPVPQSEYRIIREQWERELSTGAVTDPNAGSVRLPIQEAIRLYAERQQQQKAPPPGPPPHGGQTPSGQSSGQQPESRHQ